MRRDHLPLRAAPRRHRNAFTGAAFCIALGLSAGLAKADPPPGPRVNRDAGPIWSNDDARSKCPGVCGSPAAWTGQWRTTRAGQMSVCECVVATPPVYVAPPPPAYAVPPPAYVAPAPPSSGSAPIVSEGGKCLDVDGGDYESRVHPGRVQLWDCNGGQNQQWQLKGAALLARSGLCLDASGDAYQSRQNGARVQLWPCHGGPNQQWRVQGSAIISTNGKCVDASGPEFDARTNGARVQLWDCHGGPNQRWSMGGARVALTPPPPPPPPPPTGNRCATYAELAPDWSRLASWADDHEDDGFTLEEAAWMAQEEKRLLQPTLDVSGVALSEGRHRQLTSRLHRHLVELDRINDDGAYHDDANQVIRIALTINRIVEECRR